MGTVPSDPNRERWAAAQTRLIEAFDPQSEDERRYVQWLMSFLVPKELDLFSAMVERRLDKMQRLIRELRSVAYSRSLTAPDQMRRIRDAIGEYDGIYSDPDDDE